MSGAFVLLASKWLAAALLVQQAPPPTIDGKPYVKLATSDATRKAMRATLTGSDVEFGPWHLLAPFDVPNGSKDVGEVVPVEAELENCRADGPGPDFNRKYVGAAGAEIAWRDVTKEPSGGGPSGFDSIDFVPLVTGSHEHVAAVLHRTLTAKSFSRLKLQVGSDDGMRLWLDGALLIDVAIVRGLDVNDHTLELKLAPGVHHLFAKVVNDAGSWGFESKPKLATSRAAETALDWQLQLDFPEGEASHWRIATVAVPEEAEMEVGGLDLLPDGRPVVCTRRGDVWIVGDAGALPPVAPKLELFASGLQEPLGVAVRPDARAKMGYALWLAQRCELTRLVDLDGDEKADLYETVCDGWQLSGNYHEYAFGPRFDPDGNAWVTLNLGHTDGPTVMGAPVPTRGCALRIKPDGSFEIAADGLRSPDALNWLPGVGMAYTDNQGDYVATNKLSPMPFGSFHGHQASLVHRPGRKPDDPIPEITPPAIWFPYVRMGQSASDFQVDETGGKFGPYSSQIFVGDQTISAVMRVTLEKVGDVWQGACYPFREGFKSGVHRLAFAKDGSLWVGGTDRGWGARGGRRDALERVLFTGVVPFEMKLLTITPDGFDVTFTKPVDAKSAEDPKSWSATSWTYEYHPAYGSPELESAAQAVTSAKLVAPDRVHLVVERLKEKFVHEVHCAGVRSREGAAPLHEVGYYTVNRVPARD